MQENYLIQIKKDLQQITNMLILNGTLTECPGLVHGKIGIAIFFFHYPFSFFIMHNIQTICCLRTMRWT